MPTFHFEWRLLCCADQAFLNESRALHYVNSVKRDDMKEGIRAFREKRNPQFTLDAFEDLPDWYPWWRQLDVDARL